MDTSIYLLLFRWKDHRFVSNYIIYNYYNLFQTGGDSWLKNYDIEIFQQPKCLGDKWATFDRGNRSLCHYQESSIQFLNASCPADSVGRFIRIKLRDINYLSICEVEIFGEPFTYQNGKKYHRINHD